MRWLLVLMLLLAVPLVVQADCYSDNQGSVVLYIDGQAGTVQVNLDAPFTVTVNISPVSCLGTPVELWISSVNRNPGGRTWWLYPDNVWRTNTSPVSYGTFPLQFVYNSPIFQGPLAPGYSGTWDWYVCYYLQGLICGSVEAVVLPY